MSASSTLSDLLASIGRCRPLVAIVIIRGVKEEIMWRSIKCNKGQHKAEEGIDGWGKLAQDIYQELLFVSYMSSKVTMPLKLCIFYATTKASLL